MINSIRWRLQLWYGLILLTVVVGFAGILYLRVRQGRLGEIDGHLIGGARMLEGTLRGFRPHEVHGELPPGLAEPPGWVDPPGRPQPKDRPPYPLPKRGLPPRAEEKRPPPFGPGRLLAELHLPEEVERFGRPTERIYYAVWRPDGALLTSSTGFPTEEPMPDVPDRGGEPLIVQQGPYREVHLHGPHGTTILVGKQVARELGDLRAFAWQLAAIGVVVLGVGLAGGWAMSSRIVRPIAAISATASAISAANLSERIATDRVDQELAELGGVLNATFDRLQQAFERQVRFTADASHELRTPLAIIRTQAELALARPRPAAEYREAIETCLRASRRMTSLVEALLTLARADAGRLDLTREPVDLATVATESVDLIRPLADSKRITLTIDAAPAAVLGDAGRLAQVVTNLLSNAIQYNRPGGEVRVAVRRRGPEATLTVADTGAGIPEVDQPHLFERFYRVDRARSRTVGGNGLGLAICRSIVEAHAGVIRCDSAAGVGTTFEVTLPAHIPADDDPNRLSVTR
ncbi:MAG: ATP-binding protein [Gemmataceae bacterium]